MNGKREASTARAVVVRCLILAGALVAIYSCGSAPSAHGALYTVHECTGDNSAAPDARAVGVRYAYGVGNGCWNGGLAVGGNSDLQAHYPEDARWSFVAAPGTLIREISLSFHMHCSGGNFPYLQAIDASGNRQYWQYPTFYAPCGYHTGIACWDSWCTDSNPFTLAASYFDLAIYCQLSTCTLPGAAGAAVKDLIFTIEDFAAPGAPTFGGSLVDGGPRRGTESLVVNAGDPGSGVAVLDVSVNGVRVEHFTPACDLGGGFARRFNACPNAVAPTFQAKTDDAPWRDGDNTLIACARDYAGTDGAGNQSCSQRVVHVDNSCDDSPGAEVGSNIDAGLSVGSQQPKVNALVSSRDSVTLKGTLAGASGPVPGANVCVYQRVDSAGEKKVLADVVHTRSNGSFTSRLDAGPSRDVYVDYRHSNMVLEKQLRLDSIVRPLLKIRRRHLRNGQSMKLRGAIPGPYNDGRVVVIQARVGNVWRTFKQLTTDDEGGFKGSYRFKYSTLPLVRYVFRAVVSEQRGYPFKTGASNKAKVIVHG
jgi:hypothetical protein